MSLRWLRFADNFNILRITFEWLNINACTWVEITLKWSPNIVDKSRHMFLFLCDISCLCKKKDYVPYIHVSEKGSMNNARYTTTLVHGYPVG